MKLGLSTWSYNRSLLSKKLTLEAVIKICADEFKMDGIEIIAEELPEISDGYLSSLGSFIKNSGLVVSSLSCSNNFGVETETELEEAVIDVTEWIDVSVKIGTPILRIFAGWAPKARHAELWPNVVRGIRQAAEYAKKRKIKLAVEPHNGTGFIATASQALKLLNEISASNVGLNIDTGNYTDDDTCAAIDSTMPFAAHMHAKIKNISDDGRETEIDYDRIFRILKKHNYKGFFSVEYEAKGEEIENVPKVVGMIRRMAREHGLIPA